GALVGSHLQHRRYLAAHTVQDAVEVDVDHAVPVVQVRLAGGRLRAGDPRIVHRVVQGAVCLDGEVYDLLGIPGLRSILLDRARGPARRTDLPRHTLGRLQPDVREHDTRSHMRQPLRDRLTQPGAATGNDR